MIFKKANSLDASIEAVLQNQPQIVQFARDWAKECDWVETQDDPDNDFIDQIEPRRLLKLINKHYDGGLQAFIQDSI
jgi:hypothetical protein